MFGAAVQDEREPFDIPDVLPLLPVRDVVVFPAQVVPLFVSREISLSAVEQALARERLVFVVAQRDPGDDAPKAPGGVYALGTVSLILRQRKMPDGRVKVLVQGLLKATLESVVEESPCTRARLRKIHELPFEASGKPALEAEALARSVKTHLDKLIATGRGISPEQLLVLSGVQDPGRLADLCAASLQLKPIEAQEILEVLDPVARLRRIHDKLAKEAQLLAMQARLQSQAKEEISKTQREYYLREQLCQIQHELGERDEKAEMVADLREKIAGAGLPQPASEEAGKELRRLEAMSLESAVLRTHLEMICELPWSKHTPDALDLAEARRVLDQDQVIELSGYSEEEKLAIAQKHLLPKQAAEHGLQPEQLDLPPPTLKKIIRSYTREAGVRQLTRALAAVCRKVALQIAEGKVPAPRVGPDLNGLLGGPIYDTQAPELDETIGAATGLASTPWGGELLRVEVAAMRGKSRGLILTGQLGGVMQESAQAALSYVRGRAPSWGVAPDFFEQHELHLHVPAGAIPKDGPSAGATMAVALASLITGRPCRRRMAMTGEMTLRGRILAVGGLREKLLAAARAGVETVCIPQGNARDLAELPSSLQRELEIVTISTLDDLFAHALVGGAPVDGAKARVAVATAG
jgi:ATP-dependent Lon protease